MHAMFGRIYLSKNNSKETFFCWYVEIPCCILRPFLVPASQVTRVKYIYTKKTTCVYIYVCVIIYICVCGRKKYIYIYPPRTACRNHVCSNLLAPWKCPPQRTKRNIQHPHRPCRFAQLMRRNPSWDPTWLAALILSMSTSPSPSQSKKEGNPIMPNQPKG